MEDLKKDSPDFALSQASRDQSSQGLLVQCYCNSVIAQPTVNLKNYKNLEQYEPKINDGIATAKNHADYYLNTIRPMILINNNNIAAYYGLNKDVMSVLKKNYSDKVLIESLSDFKEQSGDYKKAADETVSKLQKLNVDLGYDTASLNKIVSELNGAVNGDNGYLQSLETELGDIQSKIDGAIAGVALSGFAIIGGIFIIVVGAVADFVTAGTSTPVVVGGIALLTAGLGGEIGSGIALGSLNNEKGKLLQDKYNLTEEVKMALGMSNGYTSLKNQAMAATNAVSQMSNAWTFMSDDLDKLIGNVQKGLYKEGTMREIYLTNANTTIGRVLDDTNIIKNQMTGVKQIPAPKGVLLSDHINNLAKDPEKYKMAA